MDIYEDALQMLEDRLEGQEWPDLQEALQRAQAHRPVAWHFPVKACEAVGGDRESSVPAVAAITCVHMAIMLVDDILDEDPRGVYRQMGAGKAANLAVGLNGLGIAVLEATNIPGRERAALELNEMIQRTAYGQALDVMNYQTEEAYWLVTRAKSSPYFGAALSIGALCGGAPISIVEPSKRIGHLYGEIMQIHDDLNDSLAAPANVDWLAGRSPLPILFAQVVDHSERDRFLELRYRVEDPATLEEAQSILVRCGAISYAVNELLKRHAHASNLLKDIPFSDPTPIEGLLEEAVAPVRRLYAKVGAKLEPSS